MIPNMIRKWLFISTASVLNIFGTWIFMTNRIVAMEAFNHVDLLTKAESCRKKIPKDFPQSDSLFFPSAYSKNVSNANSKGNASHLRGFCNWIIPGKVIVGQYPGQNPEISGPSADDVDSHLATILQDTGVNMFVSLQSEIPPQDDYNAWDQAKGQIYLEDIGSRKQFPRPFTHYAPSVETSLSATTSSNERTCRYLHWPIEDMSIPSNSQSLNELLLQLLTAIDDDDRCLYIHCWGGRGRAGLVACCLLSLLYPNVDADAILDLVQAGYDSRLGSEHMPHGLSKSPQTESQRQFVRSFVQLRKRQNFLF